MLLFLHRCWGGYFFDEYDGRSAFKWYIGAETTLRVLLDVISYVIAF